MSKEVTFYHLTSTPLEKALPTLIAKIYETQGRALVVCKDAQQMRELNDVLWTFSTKKFIPHGSIEDENIEAQPILLATTINELSNNPDTAVVLDDTNIESQTNFKKYIYMFYGNDSDSDVAKVTQLYNSYQNLGYTTKYWTLDINGKWVS